MARAITVWHGSPFKFESIAQRSPLTRLHAYWTTADPLLAALYAGPTGWVLPVMPADGHPVLDASGWPGQADLHELSQDARDRLGEALEMVGLPPVDEDGSPFGESRRTLAFSLRKGFSGRGVIPEGVHWEGVVQEDQHDNEDLNAVLRHCGYQAVLTVDPLPGILSDIHGRWLTTFAPFDFDRVEATQTNRAALLHDLACPPGAEALAIIKRCLGIIAREGRQPITIGFLEPEAAMVTGAPLPALEIMKKALLSRSVPTPVEALISLCGEPHDRTPEMRMAY